MKQAVQQYGMALLGPSSELNDWDYVLKQQQLHTERGCLQHNLILMGIGGVPQKLVPCIQLETILVMLFLYLYGYYPTTAGTGYKYI